MREKKKLKVKLGSQSYLFNEITPKEEFLNRIRSSDGSKYSRVVTSPIRYPGGKSLGVGHVVELLPEHVAKIVSPFFGGGSVEIALSKYLGIEVVGYDIFDVLVNYWQIQIADPELLYQRLSELKPDRDTFLELKNKLEDHWDKKTKSFNEWAARCNRSKRYKNLNEVDKKIEWNNKKLLNSVDLAVFYYFTYNLSYGPGFLGWPSDIYLNSLKYNSMLKSVREFSPGKLSVFCDDFQNVFKQYPDEFFYCDPPYYIGENSKMFKGVYPMRNIPIHHDGFKHEVLSDLLHNHRGKFILSYNDCEYIRELYKDFKFTFPTWQYTMGQGETRIGKNRKSRDADHIKESHEILIYNV